MSGELPVELLLGASELLVELLLGISELLGKNQNVNNVNIDNAWLALYK